MLAVYMSQVGSVNTPVLTDISSVGGSSNINQTEQSFNWKEKISTIYANKDLLLQNIQNIPKQRKVLLNGVFKANMEDKTSLGAKIGQIFENIKLKFSDLSANISQDCNTINSLLTEAVKNSVQGGGGFCSDQKIEE